MLLKPDEIGSLGNDGIRPQLRGWQAGGDGRAQKVHRGVVGQAQQLLLHRMGPVATHSESEFRGWGRLGHLQDALGS